MSPIPKAQRDATVVAATRKRDMTRAETAQYITDHWFPCSPKTLAKLCRHRWRASVPQGRPSASVQRGIS
jgi:hypothetical protein